MVASCVRMSQGRNTGWDTGWGMAEADGAKSRVTETGGHSGMGDGGWGTRDHRRTAKHICEWCSNTKTTQIAHSHK